MWNYVNTDESRLEKIMIPLFIENGQIKFLAASHINIQNIYR